MSAEIENPVDGLELAATSAGEFSPEHPAPLIEPPPLAR